MNPSIRIHKWDNLKSILMFLVVIGHFANQLTDESLIMKSISLFIYAFHMPLFIFVSGLFCKSWLEKEFSWEKPMYYILIGYLLKICIYLVKISFGKSPNFYLFEDTGIPWFMFAMAAFMVITYLTKKWNWKILLPFSILLACIAGYFDQIGNFLYLSRILVFFPFYYIGYLLKPAVVLEKVNHRFMKGLSLAILTCGLLVCVFCIKDCYSYIRLFTARNAYEFINVDHCGALHRLAWYGIAMIMSLSVIILTPNKEFKLADKIGQRTLQIYFWHRLILYVIMYSGFAKQLMEQMPMFWEMVYLAIAMVVTLLLVPKCFSLPLTLLKHWEDSMEKLSFYIERKVLSYYHSRKRLRHA